MADCVRQVRFVRLPLRGSLTDAPLVGSIVEDALERWSLDVSDRIRAKEMVTMRTKQIPTMLGVAALSLFLFARDFAFAHCDGLDGPVVKAAQQALETNNVNLVLIWVGKASEAELRTAFQQAVAVRKLSAASRALADRHLFETLVRLHRVGEGAAYTGLKPAGRDLGPAIPAADRAIESGRTTALEALLVNELRSGLRESFARVQARRTYDPDDVAAGREYVKAYVEYVHFVERLHDSITKSAPGHFEESEPR